MLENGYAVVNGRKLPLVSTVIKDQKILMTFSRFFPEEVRWPDFTSTEVYDGEGNLAFVHPGAFDLKTATTYGRFSVILDIDVQHLWSRNGAWTRV